jgi:hypothetical protein
MALPRTMTIIELVSSVFTQARRASSRELEKPTDSGFASCHSAPGTTSLLASGGLDLPLGGEGNLGEANGNGEGDFSHKSSLQAEELLATRSLLSKVISRQVNENGAPRGGGLTTTKCGFFDTVNGPGGNVT